MKKWVVFVLAAFVFASCPSTPDEYIEIEPPDVNIDGLSPNAKRLMNFIADNYGKKIISGQMDTSWTTNTSIDMIARVYADTQKYPAVKGFDFIQLPWEASGTSEQINEAIEWWDGKNNGTKLLSNNNIHGIVTFCWHWRPNNNDFYTVKVVDGVAVHNVFRIPWKDNQLDTGSADFAVIKSDLDKVAALLQQLKDKDIPVLWRPLHEAAGDADYPNSGGWFWWGIYGTYETWDKGVKIDTWNTGIAKANAAARYKALWEYMYDYFTNTKKLDNLIWVWNGQDASWFPNSETVHIVGYDVYPGAKVFTSQKARFDQTYNMGGGNFFVALTENGAIPDPDNCFKDNAMWSWFCTWNDDNSGINKSASGNFWTGEYHNTNAHKTKVYNHEKVITLDELPDLTDYRLE